MKACNQCGKCCIKYSDGGLTASAEEIDGWELFNPEIFSYVKDGLIWANPENGKLLSLCPWLQKEPNKPLYTCAVYHNRPNDCRYYPVTIDEMVRDGCEMIEVKDLSNTAKAQQQLDIIMADSRPALEG